MNKTITIITITFLLLINLALAQSGCFLYPESPAYCSDLSMEEAETECFFYEDCDLEISFFPEESCNDKQLFTECKVVLCKDSCTDELLGLCEEGPVPSGEEELWCLQGGCCQFEDYCQYKSSEGLCEIEATNNNFEDFLFPEITETECSEVCAQPLSYEQIKESLVFNQTINQTDEVIQKSLSDKNYFLPFLLALFIILIIVIHYFHHYHFKKKFWNKVKHFFLKRKKTTKVKEELKWLSPLFSTPFSRRKIKRLKQKREHKIKERNREDFLATVGLIPEKITKDEFSKLKKVVSAHQRKEKYHPELKKEKEYFHNLEDVVDKIKEREEKFRERLTHPKKFKAKKDVDELIARLREISK